MLVINGIRYGPLAVGTVAAGRSVCNLEHEPACSPA
jgi:hypothetical protein